VIGDALERVSRSGHTPTRVTMRDAIETTKIDTLQGTVSFDKNGDLASRIISVFQIKHDAGIVTVTVSGSQTGEGRQ
jgi:ABC-type branched-subunit amino acid transport system substrate-binding protein